MEPKTDGSPVPVVTVEAASTTPTDGKVVIAGASGSAALNYGDLKGKPKRSIGRELANIFRPNRAISPVTMGLLILIESAIALTVWITSPNKILPHPGEVLSSLSHLWLAEGLGQDLAVSFGLNLQALALATVISLGLCYLTVLPVFRPIVTAVSKGRFLSIAGFTAILSTFSVGGHEQKIMLLTFAISVFYITSMASVIVAIPKSDFDYARTLRMSEWRVVWEVVVLGTIDRAFDVLRQNAAIGWMMLTMVEGIVRGEGGIGTALLNQQKHFLLAHLFAIQLLILIVGLLQDYAIGALRRMVCPYADLTLERK